MKHPSVRYYELDDGTKVGVLEVRIDQDESVPNLDGGPTQRRIQNLMKLGLPVDVALMYEAAKEFAGSFDIPGDFLDTLPANLTTEFLRLLSTLVNVKDAAETMGVPVSFGVGPLYFNADDVMGPLPDDVEAQLMSKLPREVPAPRREESANVIELPRKRRR